MSAHEKDWQEAVKELRKKHFSKLCFLDKYSSVEDSAFIWQRIFCYDIKVMKLFLNFSESEFSCCYTTGGYCNDFTIEFTRLIKPAHVKDEEKEKILKLIERAKTLAIS